MMEKKLFSSNQSTKENEQLKSDLFYKITGIGRPIVLIHGGGTDSRVWKRIAKELSKKFQVIIYDLRGHGQSPVPIKETNHLDDLRILSESLNLDSFMIMGHSLGGQIATDFALLYPEKIEKLILVAPGLTGFSFDKKFEEYGKELWKAVPNVELMLETMLSAPDCYAMHKTMRSKYADEVEQIHRYNIEKSLQWQSFDVVWTLNNSAQTLQKLAMETLFLMGAEDKGDIFRIKTYFRKVPNIEFVELTEADHGVLVTHHELVLKQLIRFLLR